MHDYIRCSFKNATSRVILITKAGLLCKFWNTQKHKSNIVALIVQKCAWKTMQNIGQIGTAGAAKGYHQIITIQGLVAERERDPCLSRLQLFCLYSFWCKNTPVSAQRIVFLFWKWPLWSLSCIRQHNCTERKILIARIDVDVGAFSVSVKGGGFFGDDARQAT